MDTEVKSILSRLRRIEGQVKGIQRMIEEEAACQEILNQVSAVKSAVNQVGVIMVKRYARECVLTSKDSQSLEEALEETLDMMARVIK
ncbi:MAG: metal-sensitive transcriptional regulator [Ignavibacteriales bacterium]